MDKYSATTIRIFLFLIVAYALYLYYPFAYRTFAFLVNIDWHSSSAPLVQEQTSLDDPSPAFELFTNIFLLGTFIVGFFALPGIFLFYMWQVIKKVKTNSAQTQKSRRERYGSKDRTIAGIDEKLLLNAYNQLQHIEAAMDAKLAKIKEELVTELREEIRSMFESKKVAEHCLAKARALYKSGNHEEALGSCNSAVELSPSGLAYYIRGVVHHKLGLNNAAMDDLKTAAKLGYQKAQDFLTTKGVSY
jgi:tetratricopeptide (TPR) repeat protein